MKDLVLAPKQLVLWVWAHLVSELALLVLAQPLVVLAQQVVEAQQALEAAA